MKRTGIIFGFLMTVAMGCSVKTEGLKIACETDIEDWFLKGEWKGTFEARPDKSIDKASFYAHYSAHSSLWNQVFSYLSSTDLEHLVTDTYFIAGDSIRVIVQEYETSDRMDLHYEAHRKYIDLQYVITGKERIGIADLDQKKMVVKPYHEQEDIGFYEIGGGDLRQADNQVFFIFFPWDAHMPCIRSDESITVKKIVFKIPVNA